MYKVFGVNFVKILTFIRKTFLQMIPLPEHGSKASICRLELLLEKILATSPPTILEPEGRKFAP